MSRYLSKKSIFNIKLYVKLTRSVALIHGAQLHRAFRRWKYKFIWIDFRFRYNLLGVIFVFQNSVSEVQTEREISLQTNWNQVALAARKLFKQDNYEKAHELHKLSFFFDFWAIKLLRVKNRRKKNFRTFANHLLNLYQVKLLKACAKELIRQKWYGITKKLKSYNVSRTYSNDYFRQIWKKYFHFLYKNRIIKMITIIHFKDVAHDLVCRRRQQIVTKLQKLFSSLHRWKFMYKISYTARHVARKLRHEAESKYFRILYNEKALIIQNCFRYFNLLYKTSKSWARPFKFSNQWVVIPAISLSPISPPPVSLIGFPQYDFEIPTFSPKSLKHLTKIEIPDDPMEFEAHVRFSDLFNEPDIVLKHLYDFEIPQYEIVDELDLKLREIVSINYQSLYHFPPPFYHYQMPKQGIQYLLEAIESEISSISMQNAGKIMFAYLKKRRRHRRSNFVIYDDDDDAFYSDGTAFDSPSFHVEYLEISSTPEFVLPSHFDLELDDLLSNTIFSNAMMTLDSIIGEIDIEVEDKPCHQISNYIDESLESNIIFALNNAINSNLEIVALPEQNVQTTEKSQIITEEEKESTKEKEEEEEIISLSEEKSEFIKKEELIDVEEEKKEKSLDIKKDNSLIEPTNVKEEEEEEEIRSLSEKESKLVKDEENVSLIIEEETRSIEGMKEKSLDIKNETSLIEDFVDEESNDFPSNFDDEVLLFSEDEEEEEIFSELAESESGGSNILLEEVNKSSNKEVEEPKQLNEEEEIKSPEREIENKSTKGEENKETQAPFEYSMSSTQKDEIHETLKSVITASFSVSIDIRQICGNEIDSQQSESDVIKLDKHLTCEEENVIESNPISEPNISEKIVSGGQNYNDFDVNNDTNQEHPEIHDIHEKMDSAKEISSEDKDEVSNEKPHIEFILSKPAKQMMYDIFDSSLAFITHFNSDYGQIFMKNPSRRHRKPKVINDKLQKENTSTNNENNDLNIQICRNEINNADSLIEYQVSAEMYNQFVENVHASLWNAIETSLNFEMIIPPEIDNNISD